jgi:nucleoside-diphosphate-sugar epimerase
MVAIVRCLVTGAAGFVGSHLSERLCALGHEVQGVDCFVDYYPREVKERNLRAPRSHSGFRFEECDLSREDIVPLVRGVDWIFHQAAQAGVRASWGKDFDVYAVHTTPTTCRCGSRACRDRSRRTA